VSKRQAVVEGVKAKVRLKGQPRATWKSGAVVGPPCGERVKRVSEREVRKAGACGAGTEPRHKCPKTKGSRCSTME